MAKIIMIHSFRRGVGRTFLTSNLAVSLANCGIKVGLVDTDFELPELQLAFQAEKPGQSGSLNQVLWGDLPVEKAVVDVSASLPANDGGLWLLPASSQPEEISSALRMPLDIERFGGVLDRFIEAYDLEFVVIDCTAGLDERTMSLLALADILLVILRPDQQEYQGTALLVEIGGRLNIPRLQVVVNEVGDNLARASIKEEIRRVFHSECAAILPHNEVVPLLGKGSLLVINQPENPVSVEIMKLAQLLKV